MFLGMGPLELLTLVILGTVILGPDKIPRLVADATRILRRIRTLSDSARTDLRAQLGPEFADLELQDLHPRGIVRKAWQHASADEELQELRDIGTDLRADAASVLSADPPIPPPAPRRPEDGPPVAGRHTASPPPGPPEQIPAA
ncbi:Sec-independent protein translocase subunit TatB [Streptacidiphilus sp. ASG 303]|uniref:Sec-independent protein translocase subunit TatB n=1 Tax=Streptacidiphilus sp. ASG 303 TaxID=2896847 RepID=UPI001E627928|nr:Sec-independent protein translocase subunit TatB [Streptacidiphilus sp. ASG 303]MCD0486388.1 Sec-independent protein translocase subunit TatB [Streptacidiphilus sp. ASG 303]